MSLRVYAGWSNGRTSAQPGSLAYPLSVGLDPMLPLVVHQVTKINESIKIPKKIIDNLVLCSFITFSKLWHVFRVNVAVLDHVPMYMRVYMMSLSRKQLLVLENEQLGIPSRVI